VAARRKWLVRRWRETRQFCPELPDYHFYHFSHRLPLQIATECDRLRRVAQVVDVARIELNHFPQWVFVACGEDEKAFFGTEGCRFESCRACWVYVKWNAKWYRIALYCVFLEWPAPSAVSRSQQTTCRFFYPSHLLAAQSGDWLDHRCPGPKVTGPISVRELRTADGRVRVS